MSGIDFSGIGNIRRATRAVWAQVNPVLGDEEWAEESDTGKMKMGDGATKWNALSYRTDGNQVPPYMALRTVICATRGQYGKNGLSNGTDTATNTRVPVVVPQGANGLAVLLGNSTGNSEAVNTNPYTFVGAVEYPAGVIYPIFSNGSRSIVVPAGPALLASDFAEADVPPGATVWMRSYVSVASAGMKWPLSLTFNGVTGVDGIAAGTTQTDQTLVPGFSYPTPYIFGFSPIALLTRTAAGVKAIGITPWGIYGDSIFAGQGDTPNDQGLAVRAMVAANVPYVVLAVPGELASQFAGAGRLTRSGVARYLRRWVCNYGTNDLSANGALPLATLQSSVVSAWFALGGRSNPGYHCTLLPRVTTTDNLTTSAGQTPFAGFASGGTRSQFNAWLRAGAPMINGVAVAIGAAGALVAGMVGHPLAGFFEIADKVETARDSGLWITNGRNVSDAVMASGSTTLTSATAAFTAADTGLGIVVPGAGTSGTSGTDLVATMTYVNPTTVTLNTAAARVANGVVANIRSYTYSVDGTHPSKAGHILGQAGMPASVLQY